MKTGKVRVTKFYVAHDCGQIINPDGLRNQIRATSSRRSAGPKEELKFDRAMVTSLDWVSYPILKFPDVPDVVIELIDRPAEKPWGAGEPTPRSCRRRFQRRVRCDRCPPGPNSNTLKTRDFSGGWSATP